MYDFEEARDTSASIDTVWAVYTDVAGWPKWNDAFEAASLAGPFESGASGSVTVAIGASQDVPFVIENVERNRRFDVVWKIGPLMETRMTHTLEATPAGTRFTHAYHTGGLLAPFAFLQAATARSRVHATMERIAQLAESKKA